MYRCCNGWPGELNPSLTVAGTWTDTQSLFRHIAIKTSVRLQMWCGTPFSNIWNPHWGWSVQGWPKIWNRMRALVQNQHTRELTLVLERHNSSTTTKTWVAYSNLRMYLCWSLRTLYLHACQVRATVGDSGLCCRTCVTSLVNTS